MSVYFEIAVPELEPIDQDEQTEWDDKPEEEPQECVVRGVRLCLRRKIEMTQFCSVRLLLLHFATIRPSRISTSPGLARTKASSVSAELTAKG